MSERKEKQNVFQVKVIRRQENDCSIIQASFFNLLKLKKRKIKKVLVLDVRSAAQPEAFLIKQGMLFLARL